MPRNTAAIASSISPAPWVGLAEATRLAYIRPAAAAPRPERPNAGQTQRLDAHAGQPRRLRCCRRSRRAGARRWSARAAARRATARRAPTSVRFGSATIGPAKRNAAAREAGEGRRDRGAEKRLAAGKPEREAAEDRHRAERRDERAECRRRLTRKPLISPPTSPAASAAATPSQSEPPATNTSAATMPARLGHRADAEVEIPHRHHDRHPDGDDREHAHLLGDVEEIARG